jgi:hypothetical protein
LKQRLVRKRTFIHKHGLHAHIQRRFNAPIPGRKEPESEPEDGDADDEEDEDLSWGPIDSTYAPRICDYEDPCLKRR